MSGLVVSEMFYSIQGEGPSQGRPAVFLRLAGCNLQCNGFSYKDPLTGQHLGCDTKAVWTKGARYSSQMIINHWDEKGWLQSLGQGAHLVITGGEPCLQQKKLHAFISDLCERLGKSIYIELETNATLNLDAQFAAQISQINASPKLLSSGESRKKAYKDQVITQLSKLPTAVFKFVISNENDILEIQNNYLQPFGIENNRVWLMPEGGDIKSLNAKAIWLVEICKKYGLNYCHRLHIDIWGEVTGV